MKFRPNRRKGDQLSGIHSVGIDIDDPDTEASDDEETENIDIFGPAAPLTPPHSPLRPKKVKNKSRDVLRLHLHHGDILIQQGPDLQKYYEVLYKSMDFDGNGSM